MASSPLQVPEILALVLSFLPAPPSSPARDQLASLRLLLRLTRVARLWHSIILSPPLINQLFLAPYFPPGRSWAVPASAPWLRLRAEIENQLGSPIPRPAVAEGEPRPWKLEDQTIQADDEEHDVGSARPLLNPLLVELGLTITPVSETPQPSRFEAGMTLSRADWAQLRSRGGDEASWRGMQISAPPATEVWTRMCALNGRPDRALLKLVWGLEGTEELLREEGGVTVGALVAGLEALFEADVVEEVRVSTQKSACPMRIYEDGKCLDGADSLWCMFLAGASMAPSGMELEGWPASTDP